MEAIVYASLSHLRHELRTPVNQILGYSELLIEDAGERHLQGFIPAFQQLQSGGRRLLESIQTNLAEKMGPVEDLDVEAFKQHLRDRVGEVLEISTSLMKNLEYGHRQTLADLDAISWALRRLMEFTGQESESSQQTPLKGAQGMAVQGMPMQSMAGQSMAGQSVDPASRDLCGRSPQKKPGGQILIADDDTANRDLLRRRLEFEGHQVTEATNGLEVLECLKDQPCDLVLLDIMMPDLDGFQTLARLKQEAQWRELPVIMISALDELGSVARCIEMGAEDYLFKPFNRVLLRARIGASLEKKWLRDRELRKTDELEQTLRLLEQARSQLAVQATQDPLTGLANRRSVDSQLELRSRRETPFSVIYIDLNGFKAINDTYGHPVGDDLLKQVGDRLRLACRLTDTVGRWGDDEFVALVDAGVGDAQSHASRIDGVFSKEFAISCSKTEQSVRLSAAVGIATWRPGETVASVLQHADAEMYKEKPRNVS